MLKLLDSLLNVMCFGIRALKYCLAIYLVCSSETDAQIMSELTTTFEGSIIRQTLHLEFPC